MRFFTTRDELHPPDRGVLPEKPTKDRWPFLYRIRDEATIADMVAALQTSKSPSIRGLLCNIIRLQFRATFFEKGFPDTKQAVPALIEALADPDESVRYAVIDALEDIADSTAGPALFAQYYKEREGSTLRILLASAMGACQYTTAIPLLLQALSSSDCRLRYAATKGLKYLQDPASKKPLQIALTHEVDSATIQLMQETILELEHPLTREEKIHALIEQLSSTEPEKRLSAATNAGDFVDQRVITPLLACLSDDYQRVRHAAAFAFVSLGEGRDPTNCATSCDR